MSMRLGIRVGVIPVVGLQDTSWKAIEIFIDFKIWTQQPACNVKLHQILAFLITATVRLM